MKILLLSPINRSYVVMPSLALGYLASQLRKEGHEVSVLDCLKEGLDFSSFAEHLRAMSPQLAGIQMYSYDVTPTRAHTRIVKEILPSCYTVAGGAHPSGAPEQIFHQVPALDFAFKGEAEIGFPMLARRLDEGTRPLRQGLSGIPGLVWRENTEVRINPPRYYDTLDDLEFPAWDLIRPETYPEAGHGAFARNFPTAPLIITRGCPFRCTFCAGHTISGKRVRARSIDNVIEEMEFLASRHGVREFLIEDENLTLHQKITYEFCEKLLSSSLKAVTWSCPSGVRIDTLDRDLLRMMERAGCYSLAIGIEFGTQKMLDLTKKQLTLETIEEKVALLGETRIKTTGFFMLGVPGEDIEDMRETIRFALRLKIDRAQFNNFMPLPGSELYERLKGENRLSELNWDRFFVHDVAWEGGEFDRTSLKRLQRRAYLRFYLRPRIMFNLAREIRGVRHLKYLLKRFIDSLS